ncbi:hypothetical protein DPMN_019160 [Dreissena polymorpha]|uniref:Uncharacterized protein n=1 Tax=Dreissena polymorpha TaxID=45954 RepID=A0A9D4NIP5_DREPO|nr:hypothetical protein DPMN_019160 [Dreissena polymorpha]
MCQVKSVHPALIAIWPKCPNLETSWARDDGWPLPKNFGCRADGRMLGVGSSKL